MEKLKFVILNLFKLIIYELLIIYFLFIFLINTNASASDYLKNTFSNKL